MRNHIIRKNFESQVYIYIYTHTFSSLIAVLNQFFVTVITEYSPYCYFTIVNNISMNKRRLLFPPRGRPDISMENALWSCYWWLNGRIQYFPNHHCPLPLNLISVQQLTAKSSRLACTAELGKFLSGCRVNKQGRALIYIGVE